jgi:hypothetical protein
MAHLREEAASLSADAQRQASAAHSLDIKARTRHQARAPRLCVPCLQESFLCLLCLMRLIC